MKASFPNHSVCSRTKKRLHLLVEEQKGDEIISGELIPEGETTGYRIDRGVPSFVREDSQSQDSVEGFGFQWSNEEIAVPSVDSYLDDHPFLEAVDWQKIHFPGARVLEAGCGNGRISRIFLKEEIELFAFDLSESIYTAYERYGKNPHAHFFRADMTQAPFPDAYFDIIVASAVLQHTESPPNTVRQLSRLLKPGGYMITGLYMIPEKFLTRIKIRIIDGVRFMLRHLPKRTTYYWSYLSVICFHKVKLLYPLGRLFFIRNTVNDSERFTWLINHDEYISGSFQHLYSRADTLTMFRKAGLVAIRESSLHDNCYLLKKFI